MRVIQHTLEKSQIGANRGDTSAMSLNESNSGQSHTGGEALSVGASTIMPKTIRDISRGQKKQSPDVFQKKFDEYEYMLDIFKKQIDSNFDQDLIQ